jgi:alkaline phosphatase
MSRLKTLPALFVLAAALVAASVAAATPPAAPRASPAARPRNVILMIPDGCGWASITLARIVAGHPLALDGILVGACETHPADDLITDSAAAATAFASGIKTRNRELGLTWDQKPVATVLEAARARGMSTGLVATSRITHATPAAFASHEAERDSEDTIAVAELDHHIDVMLGGGRAQFVPRAAGGQREDGRDLLEEARRAGVTVIASRAELRQGLKAPVLGLFAPDHMSYEIDRDTLTEPSLTEMTRRALALLAPNRRGFFIMIEGSRVDHAAHQNDAATHVREVLAYDEAVAAALEFARRDGHTLVISVSDHECGGLSVGAWSERDRKSRLEPGVLRRARASAARMAGAIGDGGTIEEVLLREAGNTDLTPVEIATLREAATRGELTESIGTLVSRRAGVGWTTWSHTAEDVGLYAVGPGAERLRGVHENTEIAHVIAALLHLDLDGLTARLQKAAAAPPTRR